MRVYVALSVVPEGLLPSHSEMNNLYREPAIDASYQVWIHLTKRFQRRRFF